MKKKGLRITSFIVLVIIMLTMGATVSNAAPQSSEDFVPEPPRYTETSLKNWYRLENDADKYRIDTAKMRLNGKKLDGGSFPFNKDDVLSFDFQTEQAEDYIIVLEYKSFEESVNDCRITVKCDTETAVAALPILWADKTGNYSFDRNGNHQIPEQIAVDGYICNPLEDVNSSALSKLVFRLAAGKHTISLAMNLHSLEIKNIYVMPETKIPEYSQYLEAHNSRLNENGETVALAIDAEGKADYSALAAGTYRVMIFADAEQISEFELRIEQTPPEPEEPDDGKDEQPPVPDEGTDDNEQDKPGDESGGQTEENGNAPTLAVLFVLLGVLAACGIAVLIAKKRKNKTEKK